MADDHDGDEDYNHYEKSISDKACGSGHHHEAKHYFGCLRVEDRSEYFETLEPKQQDRLRTEIRRFARMRRFFEEQDTDKTARILVTDLETSLKEWRSLQHFPNKPVVMEPDIAPAAEVVEQDVKDLHLLPENDPDLKANLIFYKGSRSYSHPQFHDTFPHQKISLKSLLFEKDKKTNPLMMDCEKDMIRYIHLPANNMSWVEESLRASKHLLLATDCQKQEAIALYYNEDRPDLNHPFQKPCKHEKSPKTTMLLRPQFWRNLQHGGRQDLPLHSRHMRPRCYSISTGIYTNSLV